MSPSQLQNGAPKSDGAAVAGSSKTRVEVQADKPHPSSYKKKLAKQGTMSNRVRSKGKVAHNDLIAGTNLDFDLGIEAVHAVLSWKSRNSKMGFDLDITGITYDLKGQFLELIGFDSPTSNDASIALSGDSDGLNGADEEMLAIDLSAVSPKVRLPFMISILCLWVLIRSQPYLVMSCRCLCFALAVRTLLPASTRPRVFLFSSPLTCCPCSLHVRFARCSFSCCARILRFA